MNCVYRDKPFGVYRGYISGEARLPSSGSEYRLMNTFELIKAVSDNVLDMINAVYHGNPLRFISFLSGLCFRRSLSPIIRQ